MEASEPVPLWLWPNLLSLDAPVIAVIWQLLAARVVRVNPGWAEPLALFLGVWVTYLVDRVLDAGLAVPPGWEPERKRFYRRRWGLMATLCSTLGLGGLLLGYFALSPALFLCGVGLAICAAAYLAVVHSRLAAGQAGWPRELIVALIFSFGAIFPLAFAGRQLSRILAACLVFTILCFVNCSVIETWEWQRNPVTRAPSVLAQTVERHSIAVLSLTLLICLVLWRWQLASTAYLTAAVLACLMLQAVSVCRNRWSSSLTRVAADAALCSPLILMLCGFGR